MPTLSLPTLADTAAFASSLALKLRSGDTLALEGDLGAGKTAFCRALIQHFLAGEEVPSPTFTLLQTYETQAFPIYHFDLYRLKTPTELEEIGWDDALASGLVLVEWPQKAGPYLPSNAMKLLFEKLPDDTRQVTYDPKAPWLSRTA